MKDKKVIVKTLEVWLKEQPQQIQNVLSKYVVKIAILFLLIGCSSTEPKVQSVEYEKIIIDTTDKCTYGYWKKETTYVTFCECKTGYSCSVSN